MPNTRIDEKLSGVVTVGGLGVDVDIDGSFQLFHEQPTSDDAKHPFALDLPEIAALLNFFDTPRGKRIQELARAAAPAAPAAEPTPSLAEAWRALPREKQERISERLTAHVRQAVATPELAHLVERPESAALLAEQAEKQPATPGTPAAQRTAPPLEVGFREGGLAFDALVDAGAFMRSINDRLAEKVGLPDVLGIADRLILAFERAGLDLPDSDLWEASEWYRRTTDEAENAVGWLLGLRAFADRPDLCAAMVRHVAALLAKGLLTDLEYTRDEV